MNTSREAVALYIDALAGPETQHQAIAKAINERNPGSRVAGTLVGRWRGCKLDLTPGSLAALARAYGRNPLEAFVVAGLLTLDEALDALDADAVRLIKRIEQGASGPVADGPISLEEKRRLFQERASQVREDAARDEGGKPTLGED
ncbi:hypothetical protein [Nocardioides alcanivorans]|uniref:hypothetical protein n=1 Tax=Nocardioides alcanivorans TaxID=2897352 RepID=UPI001F2AA28D|nr:hypothetical protein [Nocardioides alcanivorans]